MCGGKVIETVVTDDSVWINVKDRNDTCAIYVDKTPEARSVSEGDSLWWQGGYAFWTAKDKNGKAIGKIETKLKRRGYSGAKRPEILVK